MTDPKPSYADLVYQTVRESNEPLPFAEILERVNSLLPITTRNPKSTIRNAISQAKLIMHTSDGRYGWKYRLINGSSIRLPLSDTDLIQHQIIYSEELKDALWPSFFENKKHSDRSPALLALANGISTELPLTWLGFSVWGTQGSPEFWDWLDFVKAKPGDDLIFHVIDSEARRYEVEFQAQSERNEPTIAERNQQMIEATFVYNRQNRFIIGIWDISSHLLAIGLYKHPVPPDPLEQLLADNLWGPDSPSSSGPES
jgi:hypothetical protein